MLICFNLTDATNKKSSTLESVLLNLVRQDDAEISNDDTSEIPGSSERRLVEAMGVEPMSEKSSARVSPGAGNQQHSLRVTPVARLTLQ